MFPYFWGSLPLNMPNGTAFGMLPYITDDLRDLPEEVRQALEDHRDEIHSASDLKHLADEMELRR